MQRSSGSQDRNLRQRLHHMEGTPSARASGLVLLEGGIRVQEIRNLFDNHPDIAAKVVDRQPAFHEFLLLHQDLVGDVKDDSLSEDGRREVLYIEVSLQGI